MLNLLLNELPLWALLAMALAVWIFLNWIPIWAVQKLLCNIPEDVIWWHRLLLTVAALFAVVALIAAFLQVVGLLL